MYRLLSLIVIPLVLVTGGSAAPIPVNNFSFEMFNPLNLACVGTNCAFNQAAIPGWTNSGVNSGNWRPGNPANTNYFDFIPDGSMIAYTNAEAIEQAVGTVTLGTTYTLTVAVGNRKDFAQTGAISLIIGSNLFVANGTGGTAPEGGWIDYTAVYAAQAAHVGQTISIRLSTSSTFQADFDNVRLEATGGGPAVPEPGTAAMLLFGLAALTSVRFRRSRLNQ